ncbi:MAG: SRPBCC domain-containing protein [Bryobacteraceae bacterium]|nr:SRPBCC domain-containing protein [Bryobacteraceae bacterium]
MSRAHETTITIDAPIEDVWRALTEAREIERWFAPEASVNPGPGGSITVSWGPGMSGTQTIEVWEPNRQLRLIDDRTQGPSPARLVVDYFLEAVDGKTVLRLVHAGFGPGPDWDGEYEGTRIGWPGFFRTLRHGLERHPGKPARNVNFFHAAPVGDSDTLWDQLFSSIPWQGPELFRNETPRCYQGVVTALDDALLNVALTSKDTGNFIYLNLVLYGLPAEQVEAIESQWKAAMAALPAVEAKP